MLVQEIVVVSIAGFHETQSWNYLDMLQDKSRLKLGQVMKQDFGTSMAMTLSSFIGSMD